MKLFVRMKSKRMIFWVVLFFILSVIVYIPVRRGVLKSEPYRMSENFVTRNTGVINVFGKDLQCELKTFAGYSLQYYTNGGDAEFDIYVKGDKGKGKVNIGLTKKEDKWEIIDARLYANEGNKIINLLGEVE